MKFDQKIVWKVEKEERVYRLEMPVNANLGEAYQVVGEFMDQMVKLINEHAAQNKKEDEPLQEEEQKPEEVKDECVQESIKDV